MDARRESEPTPMKNRTTVERKSERELVVTRTFNGPARIVFEAWTKPELFKRWWVPKSFGMSLLSCEMDVRVGGTYRLVFGLDGSKPMAFFGRYLEVTPHSRLVWTNDEGGDGGAVTTVTFEEKDGKTLLVLHELYPSKEALDAAIASGATGDARDVRATRRAPRHPGARAWDGRRTLLPDEHRVPAATRLVARIAPVNWSLGGSVVAPFGSASSRGCGGAAWPAPAPTVPGSLDSPPLPKTQRTLKEDARWAKERMT